MDPRIHWEDILMSMEVLNRTVGSNRHLQNSTNNLINRQEHRTFSIPSWQNTETQEMKSLKSRPMKVNKR